MDEIYYSEIELQDIIEQRVLELDSVLINTPEDNILLKYSTIVEMYKDLVGTLYKEIDDMQNEIDYLNYYIDTLLDDIND